MLLFKIGLFLCHNLIQSNALEVVIPVPLSPLPSNPESFTTYISAFFAHPKVLPATVDATCVPCPGGT